MLIYPIASVWAIQTPVVYRCLKREYVDNFFKDGELRLSSFKKFRQHPNEKAKDGMEGILSVVGYHRPSNSHITGIQQAGWHSYILCGTAHNTKEKVNSFDTDAAIQIFDTTNFGIEIGKQIGGLRKGIEGFCIYNDGPIEFLLPDDALPHEILKEADKHAATGRDDLSHFTNGMETSQTNAVYFKKRPAFQHEMEYRWVWVTDNREESEIIIKCPSARAFCRPFYCE